MKKSKFQEKLNEAAKNYDPEEDKGSMNDQVKLHKMHDKGIQPSPSQSAQQWISVNIEKPPYYAPVNIWDGKQIYTNWARVICPFPIGVNASGLVELYSKCDIEKDYYVNSLSSNSVVGECKHNVTFWSYPEGVSYPKYEPMTAKDLPGYELKELIKAMRKMKAKKNNYYYNEIASGYNTGIEECIQIVERRLKRIQKTSQVKLHKT